MKILSLRKSRSILCDGIARYRKIHKKCSSELCSAFESKIEALQEAITVKNKEKASECAFQLSDFLHTKTKKTFLEGCIEFFVALFIAILIAICVRGWWFELYEIPTGSMRPTIKEHDRAFVSKDSFGINHLFGTGHYIFDPSLMQRGSTIVFRVDDLDIPDPDTYDFYFFKTKKRYVKRCMGKGGDTIYFYGGKVYGIDKEGNPLPELYEGPYCSLYEHVPFLSFEGRVDRENENEESELIFKQMDLPIGKISIDGNANFDPKIMRGGKWVSGTDLSSFWGIGNFAMCRLINPQDLPQEASVGGYTNKEAILYLELRHDPELPENSWSMDVERQKQEKYITPSYLFCRTTWIPLTQEDVNHIASDLYTCRFVVSKGFGYRYSFESIVPNGRGVFLGSDIPSGTYEFFNGVLYKIGWFSYAQKMGKDHPLYSHSPELVRKLFNCGVEFSTATDPASALASKGQKRPMVLYPERYAYFADGNLVVLGHTLFPKGNAALAHFYELEQARTKKDTFYTPFEDKGAPFRDGKLDVDFISKYGLKIPEAHVLALGDNHAMSGDSRIFGFVPYANIKGSVVCIVWPLGDRLGSIPQPSIPFWHISNILVLAAALVTSLLSWYWWHSRSSFAAYKKLKRHT